MGTKASKKSGIIGKAHKHSDDQAVLRDKKDAGEAVSKTEGFFDKSLRILAELQKEYPDSTKEALAVELMELIWDFMAEGREQAFGSKAHLRMIFTKMIREAYRPKADNVHDAQNYWGLYAKIVHPEVG